MAKKRVYKVEVRKRKDGQADLFLIGKSQRGTNVPVKSVRVNHAELANSLAALEAYFPARKSDLSTGI